MISDYASLQTAVANWLNRSDLTAYIPDFITLCETDFNRKLRIRSMESRVQAVINAGGPSTLPSSYVGAKRIILTSDPNPPIDYVTPEQWSKMYPITTLQGRPKKFTLIGNEIHFAPIPDSAYTVEMILYAPFTALSSGVNWMITNAPDVYLYGTLLQSAPFIKDKDSLEVWGQFYQNGIDWLNKRDADDRHPTNSLMVRSDSNPS
jgi:hypothetical protein